MEFFKPKIETQTTLLYIFRKYKNENQILLAMKKRGLGLIVKFCVVLFNSKLFEKKKKGVGQFYEFFFFLAAKK